MPEQNGGQKHWYRPDEVAQLLDERTRWVYRLIKSGKIRAIIVGRKLKIPAEEVYKLISRGTK